MKIEAEESRYHGDAGWESDPQLFAQVAVTWNQWIGQAGEHWYTAQVLLPHIQTRNAEIRRLMEAQHRRPVKMAPCLTGIYFLHCAFGIENAFKAVITTQLCDEIRAQILKTTEIPKVLRTHDLLRLARRADFPVGPNEEYALRFLSRYGTWAGRYPLPVRNADNAPTDQLSNGNHYLMAGYRPDGIPAYLDCCAVVYKWARARVEPSPTTETNDVEEAAERA
jgi:hypothetical protein